MYIKNVVLGLFGAFTCWFTAYILSSFVYNYIISIIEAGNDGNWGTVLVGALIIYLGGGITIVILTLLLIGGVYCFLSIWDE